MNKLALLIIILYGQFIHSINHYVDNNANGLNNGTNWVNAWESFSSINWSLILPGDIIYISGGTSSKTYNEAIVVNASGIIGLPITITKGIDSGHNGEVIIQGSGSGAGIQITDRSFIVVSNLTINDWLTGVGIKGNSSNSAHNIIVDNCDGRMAGRFLHIQGYPDVTGSYCHDITIRNCDVTTPASIGNQNDFIYAQYMAGLTIENNYVNISNNDPTPHNDCVQTFWVDGPVIVRNNYFEHSDTKTRNSQGIFFENHEGTFEVYNNIIVMPNSWDSKIYWKSSSLNNAHTIIYSNTIYGLTGDLITTTDPNAVIKNNILYSTGWESGSYNYMIHFNGVSGSNADISTNLFYDPAGNMGNMNSGSCSDCLEGNPLFTNISLRDFTVQNGSPAIDAGTTLLSPFNLDITGILRPQGLLFDIGAFEKLAGGGGGNNPPNQPSNPDPANGSTGQLINLTMTWTCTDPDGDPLTYDVYFGTSSNPPLVSSNQTNSSFDPGQLNNSTTYYWKILAKDNQGATTTGPTWNFSTENAGGGNNPPNEPNNPNPIDGAVNQSTNLTLTWACTDPDGDPLTYDVFFGTNNNPPLVTSNQSNASYDPGQLNNSTTYYWKILARDNQGATNTGPIWNFTTEEPGGGDTTPPELVGIQIVESDEIVLDFSEPMDSTGINNFQNYNISNQIQILGANLNPASTRLYLSTTNHDSNFVYTIEVTGLKDIAGNVISQTANSSFYKLLDFSPVTYREYLIDNVDASSTSDTMTSPAKTLDGLVNGDPDPNSRWATQFMPQWLQYDLGSVRSINLIATSFYRWEAGRIYVYSIQVSDDATTWNEIISNQTSVPQEWTFNEFQSLNARYVRVICLSNNEADWAGLWETRIFGPDSITAVELILLTATVTENNDVRLNWTTATETNNQRFDIQRSNGGNPFITIGSVPGHGTTSELQHYTFTDTAVEGGSYTYRLKLIEFSGQFSYSNEIEVTVNNPSAFDLKQNYPNPFNPSTTITFSIPENQNVNITVYNILGKAISELTNREYQSGTHSISFDGADLTSGIYFYRIETPGFIQTKKMTLLR